MAIGMFFLMEQNFLELSMFCITDDIHQCVISYWQNRLLLCSKPLAHTSYNRFLRVRS